jgi:hypothetical protein
MGVNDMSLPLRHLSVRVPWHDAGWNATFCHDPIGNSACLRLANIHLRRRDDHEVALAGTPIKDLSDLNALPPCVAERAAFMASVELRRSAEHPYSHS